MKINPDELWYYLNVIDRCNDFGVPWRENVMSALSTQNEFVILATMRQLLDHVGEEIKRIDKGTS